MSNVVQMRVPPHDLDSEAAVLSVILLESTGLDRVLDLLKPEHFYSEANRRIYEAAISLATNSTPIDIVSVATELRNRDRLAQVGGATYLAQIVDASPSVSHVEVYARTIREKWRIRELISSCQKVVAEAYGDVGDAQQFIDHAEQAIYDIARTPETSSVQLVEPIVREVFTQITEAAKNGQKITGLSTHFDRLDGMTAGLHDGDLTIVAARPGMGKTAFVMNVAVNMTTPVDDAIQIGAIVFSLEMPREQLASRMVCSEGRVDLGKMRQGFLQDRDWNHLTQAASFLYRLPIWIDDTPALDPLSMRAKIRRIQAEFNRRRDDGTWERRIGLVAIDYLQLMRGNGSYGNREAEISDISRTLKQLAKELRVPVVALSQLNRAVETRGKNKRPQLSDLRESGAIEQDADNIIFVYRDDYYDEMTELKGIAELIIAKQRSGPTGKVKVRFNPSYTRFDNLAPGEYEGDDEAA
jgi:replicative DNA helicase